MQDGRPSGEHRGQGTRRRQVHRDRQQVLDDHEAASVERAGEFDGRWRGRVGPDGQAWHDHVDRALTRYGPHGEPEVAQRLLPGGGHHGDAVGPAEAERHDRAA